MEPTKSQVGPATRPSTGRLSRCLARLYRGLARLYRGLALLPEEDPAVRRIIDGLLGQLEPEPSFSALLAARRRVWTLWGQEAPE
jgi:hypothetical protein